MEAPEHEIWLTKIFNDNLAPVGNSILNLVGLPSQHRPWANFITMQLLVVAILMVLLAILNSKLSVDRPGKLQHTFEVIHEFLGEQTDDQIPHHGRKYLAYFGTLFLFILFANLIGIIPGFESPTMNPVCARYVKIVLRSSRSSPIV